MKHTFINRLCALTLALCLCALPTLASAADTYLPDGDVTHTDFTLSLALHADGFPQSKAHLDDWETFLGKLSLAGAMDSLAMFTPDSRVYLNAALRLNGKDRLPFVYDGYHSYRYLTSPALNDEVLYFQMHNFLEFMLKPYFYMELPTQYLALLMYPEAAYWLGDSYYTPVKELLSEARDTALGDATAPVTTVANDGEGSLTIIGGADGPTQIYLATPDDDAAEGDILLYTVPYQDLYELCETLDLIVNDDVELGRAYFFFTCLLTEIYASDMVLDMLGDLESELDSLDPDEKGMTVMETPVSTICSIGDTVVFMKTVKDSVTTYAFTLPTPDGYVLTFNYSWAPQDEGAALSAALAVTLDGVEAVALTAEGEGLPREGELGGQGSLTLAASGFTIGEDVPPAIFDFSWSRDAAQKPYTLDLTVDWIHPETLKPALTLAFNGTLSTVDKSVFVEKSYPQNDFFNLNETFLEEYKARLLPSMLLKLTPFVLEMPSGVIDDIYRFTADTDILVSFIE